MTDEKEKEIKNIDYFLCENPNCDVVYFSEDENIIVIKNEIKVPVWFKKDADPKYLCYCNEVTEDQIINAVINEGGRDMKDIIRLTGAMKNGQCEIKNPSGKCCQKVVQEAIDKGLDEI